ncbi:LysM peptidoglycan-binding domain-containing protein [Bacillus salacetis]|uniref:LysM peptidoglycan-binding domain-containing protein n=1 Tax=Bacillus salacetis TaxID=2315464 RepID=A0A3A1QS71_9BACI|nr:peptidoglycan DD-metalloendopeptidase family protein [Bacillus salacetis]RIW27995.1 LysM peptidoglycan-binding domain-containing protein [Bacillus salacetis]
MIDYIRRVLIVGLLALCVSLLFISGRTAQAEEEATSRWVFPADGYITDHFGTRGGKHKGMDIGGEEGTPVYSAADGVVSKSYYSSSYGHVVFVKHPHGYETVYGHLLERKADEGQAVKKGEEIGSMGNTGRSTGTHLHFEVHRGEWNITKDYAIDPYQVYGKGETGQTVFANEHDPYQVREVALRVAETEEINSMEPAMKVHTVQSGETLWRIAQTYGVSTEDMLKENNLESPAIISGEKLIIPEKSGKMHRVQQGETLFGIGKQYGMSVKELAAMNDLNADEPIMPFQELLVRQD